MEPIRVYESRMEGGTRLAPAPAPTLRADADGQEMHLVQLYADVPEQVIGGFGGAFTQAAAGLYAAMDDDGRREIMRLLFSPEGLAYNCGRVPIGACDFSDGNYSYCDKADPSLANFSLGRDADTVIPFIKDALAQVPSLELMASPWSPPAWMKTNGDMCRGGRLKEDCYDPWADYIVRYIKACGEAGVPVHLLTTQNEPKAVQTWESCVYTAQEEQRFIRDHLAPALKAAGLADVGIVIWDHNKERSFLRAREIMDSDAMRGIVRGIAFHWYSGDHFEDLALCRKFFPDQELMFTEGCVELTTTKTTMAAKAQSAGRGDGVASAPWAFGEIYAHDIIGNLNAGMGRFIDWNLMLDTQGGPNHVGNYCSAPLICDVPAGRIYPQPSYHAIAHFSRFIPRGSRRLAVSRYTQELEVTAALTPDGDLVAVAMNPTDKPLPAVFSLVPAGKLCEMELAAHSLVTCVFPKGCLG